MTDTMDSNLTGISDTERTAAATYGAIDKLIICMDQRQLRARVIAAARMLVDAYDEGYEDWCLWDGLREAVRQEGVKSNGAI